MPQFFQVLRAATVASALALVFAKAAIAVPFKDSSSNHSILEARQGDTATCPLQGDTKLVGDGDPHQTFYHEQVSDKLGCGDGECAITSEESWSISVGFSSEISSAEWIAGGFSVEKEYSKTQGYSCYGVAGDEVCLWQMVQHTDYTVQNIKVNPCTLAESEPDGDPFVLSSPNSEQGNYYCVRNACREKGEGHWEDRSKPGTA
ncbi:uncharacterized protein MYCFIDRAFT_78754 [Pseudocercospora fijiensis CIRAD86]|uniref:Ig-like domain-containing protein n=1 Tax=Pseudocercospora fijiensis (strain CIRAD86) TaxID=383855 RepID=M2ZS01_PSEFD|nr:uncharacterized protein MYCFIDRAFT_78754 [Pseudocercospora fijiensis CIRAD86]EME81814.1 hypothetical protein MYCFIDRAFT_78754 [Pseudocercospora fijiensis CIRAD86]